MRVGRHTDSLGFSDGLNRRCLDTDFVFSSGSFERQNVPLGSIKFMEFFDHNERLSSTDIGRCLVKLFRSYFGAVFSEDSNCFISQNI